MAIGLKIPEDILPVEGIRLSACSAGIYKKSRADVALIAFDLSASCAAVFTRNLFCAAPVIIARKHIQKGPSGYCLINAGNANAGTGERGIDDALKVCKKLAQPTGSRVEAILPFSTGVIGEFIPVEKICNVIPDLISNLDKNNWMDCAKAIMTTDTIPKAVSRTIKLEGETIVITGLAKGSGMIRPDMATMLAFLGTNAAVEQYVLNEMLITAVNKSFNRICVDGDTSTNDACVLVATGKSKMNTITDINSQDGQILQAAIVNVCADLAQSIIRDGEGASKFITLRVFEGKTSDECLAIAYAIATSPLVKTALFASDPNWGRILAAIGRSGIPDLDITNVEIYLNNICIVEKGMRSDKYNESTGITEMAKDDIVIDVYLGRGDINETIWTCDLSFEYVRINAEYRT